ncbi:Hint domain-containing protein [Pseudodonghicola flavimaris]|uniref:Hint domain-containing protein n=1 Tax=Pseudodonghicola flavimaris TaxID=3050036 RepID=A0ABT7EV50_9RHOB|nr:Hint domain-containing protein [Pseudodonghicola flavimaris]MDK3016217.1 Hint domain-containing protein [Pseudodonghicola flavimaris]
MTTTDSPIQAIAVYPARSFRVTEGANLGDPIADMDDLILDDIYELSPEAEPQRLVLEALGDGGFRIAENSERGTPGAPLHLDSALQFMSPDGQMTEALILVELDPEGLIAGLSLLPLSPLRPKTEYRLVRVDRDSARVKFAQIACVSFSRGTRITLATGAQVAIEDLKVGDRVLTRDDGPQEIRWIGQSTVRAAGAFAPIVITAGTLNNSGDLVVSPDHRLFVYQRSDRLGAGRPELLVKARHLIDGDKVYVQTGGFVDYFQLLFDRHHIIYAEGIAAESLLVDPRTRPALPPELLDQIGDDLPGHARQDAHGVDVQKALLDRPDAIDLLRRASTD